jgi:PadR family transcriptional regulator, regulatory protein AphA
MLASAQEPQHGYALYRRIQADLKDVWTIGMNRLYSLLAELEHDGLIAGQTEKPGPRPARRMLRLLPKGKNLFNAWMDAPTTRMRDMRLEFLPKLYFARLAGPDAVVALIRVQHTACDNELARMAATQSERGSEDMYVFLVYEFRVRQIRSMMLWLDECERTLGLAHVAAHAPSSAS